MSRGVRAALGLLLLGIAAVLLLFEIVALGDPVGTQMANDADPFGTPPGWEVHAVWFTVIAGMTATALWMILGGRRKRNAPTHSRYRG